MIAPAIPLEQYLKTKEIGEQNRAPKHPVGRFSLLRPHLRMLGDGSRYVSELQDSNLVSSSESFFQRTLDEKTKQAREAVQTCVVSFLSPSPNNRQQAASAALDSVARVMDMLHPQDRPNWLTSLHSALQTAVSNHGDSNGIESLQRIANDLQGQLNRHKWRLADINTADGFDFDTLYTKYKSENRISELFDEIIAALNEIVESGAIDSVRALEELRKIIATLQNAKNGSYFATRNSWFFVATWFKNTGWELLGDIPVLGAAVRGLRKSLEDMNVGMQHLHDQIQVELQTKLSTDFPRLDYTPPALPRIEYRPDAEDQETT